MIYQYSPYITPLFFAAVVSSWVVVYGFAHRRTPTAVALMLLGLAITEWLIGYALEILGADQATKLFWGKMQYVGISLIPFFWLALAVTRANLTDWLTRRSIPALLILPVVTILLALTNDSHGLIWRTTFLNQVGKYAFLGVKYGVWFWIHSAYSYALLLAGTLLLLRSVSRGKLLYRRQAATLLLGVLVPWVGNALYIFGFSPFPYLDPTPFFFTISVAAFAWSIYGFQLVDLPPIAQDNVIAEMNDGMIVLDTSNRIVDINPAALKMIGRTESETIGKTLPRVIPNLPDLLDKYLDIPETQDEITIGSGAAQRWFDLRIASLHDKRRRVIGRVITVHDITARKQTEIRLHESEARYRQIVENAGDIIYRTDASGYFTYVNQPALHIMGFTRESQVLGKHLTDLAAPASRHALKRFYDRQYMLREANTYYEFAAVRADGQEVWIGQNVQIIEEDGQVVGFQAVARDITEIRRARDTMAYARDQAIEANRLKSQLLARVSHELRIPLSGIMGFAELLRDNAYGQLTDEQRRVMEQILDSTNYLTKLIEDLLHQAQMEAKAIQLHREPVALKELFRNVQKNMSVLARTKKLSLSGVYSDDLPDTITGDSQHLQQIMFNLLGNAIKFTKNGGVQIRASRPDAEHWTFEVSDTGIGIPEEAHERIFEPFQQVEGLTEEENLGTGLGLAIAHQLVELMGGTIKVSSKLNVGSTFTVTLPIEQG